MHYLDSKREFCKTGILPERKIIESKPLTAYILQIAGLAVFLYIIYNLMYFLRVLNPYSVGGVIGMVIGIAIAKYALHLQTIQEVFIVAMIGFWGGILFGGVAGRSIKSDRKDESDDDTTETKTDGDTK